MHFLVSSKDVRSFVKDVHVDVKTLLGEEDWEG